MAAETAEQSNNVDTLYPAADTQPAEQTTKYTRLTLADTELILKLHYNGQKQTDIAQILGVSQSTISDVLSKLKQTPELSQALMRSDSLSAIKDWRRARKVAAKRGDHRPAREWMEMAHPELRPQTAASAGGGGVTIVIGMPGQPVQLPSITIESTPLSPSNQKVLGEGLQNP